MFKSARIILTMWYVVIIGAITITISGLFYLQTAKIISSEYDRIERRLQREALGMPMMGDPPPGIGLRRILPEDLAEAKRQILVQLAAINALILLVAGGLSFVLAGKTLRPIEIAHEKQRRFIADAAHELRTPITAMKTSLEVSLMKKNLTKETSALLRENVADLNRLDHLTESLLSLAKVEDSMVALESIIQIQQIVSEAVETLRAVARNKHISIQVNSESQDKVLGIESELLELFVILLDNAIKFSPTKGQIFITTQSANAKVKISLSDQGPGIPIEMQTKIFERFYQADTARTSSATHGFGLGLAIAKEIVARHRGSIEALNNPDKGASFIVTLPVAAD